MKKIVKILFLAISMMFLGHHAQAQRVSKVTGKGLSSFCSDAKMVKICDAYIAGITDSEVWAHDFDVLEHHPTNPAFCIPAEQTTPQIRNLVVAWLGAHLDAMNEPAGKAVYRALYENYPCHLAPTSPKVKK